MSRRAGAGPKQPRTLYEKIWQDHVIMEREDGTCLVWVDRHIGG